MTWILALTAILGALLVGAVSPGPSFVQVARVSVAGGRAEGIATAVGMGVGAAFFGVIALLGLHGVLAQVPWLYMILKVAGGLYLLHLAWGLFRGARQPLSVTVEDGRHRRGLVKTFLIGLSVQLSNPKIALVFAGVFAALMPSDTPPAWVFFVLPPLILIQETAWYAIVAAVFSSPRPRAAYLRAKMWIDGAAGTAMAALGLRLIWEAVRGK